MQTFQSQARTADGLMNVHIVKPSGAGPYPAMIVLQEAFGVNSHIIDICKHFASKGYVALAPELFHRAGDNMTYGYGDFQKLLSEVLAPLTNDRLADDVGATHRLAQSLPEVQADKVGVIGYCMGGFTAVLGACRTPVQVAISFYGGGMAKPRPGFGFQPFLSELKNVRCPVYLGCGEKDASIPMEDIEVVSGQLKKDGKEVHVKVYPDANHAFMNDERPSYNPEQTKIAWEDTFAWLKESGL